MKVARSVTIVWVIVIVVLIVLELAELTHFFTLPLGAALADPLAFIFSLVFTSLVSIIGAIFIGIYISQRLLSQSGFTPFEEEMLRMRTEIHAIGTNVEELRRAIRPDAPGPDPRAPRQERH
jgi:membrane protein implicated in regulation of membrane protease activity